MTFTIFGCSVVRICLNLHTLQLQFSDCMLMSLLSVVMTMMMMMMMMMTTTTIMLTVRYKSSTIFCVTTTSMSLRDVVRVFTVYIRLPLIPVVSNVIASINALAMTLANTLGLRMSKIFYTMSQKKGAAFIFCRAVPICAVMLQFLHQCVYRSFLHQTHCVLYKLCARPASISFAAGQPTRPTQPFILSGSINEY